MRALQIGTLCLLAGVASACFQSRESAATQAAGASQSKELNDYQTALARWRASAPASYVFKVQFSCMACGPELRVVVDNGVVVSAAAADGRSAQGTTIDELFKEAHDAISAPHVALSIRYDSTWGYPSVIMVDRSSASDDETGTYVSCFAEGVSQVACP